MTPTTLATFDEFNTYMYSLIDHLKVAGETKTKAGKIWAGYAPRDAAGERALHERHVSRIVWMDEVRFCTKGTLAKQGFRIAVPMRAVDNTICGITRLHTNSPSAQRCRFSGESGVYGTKWRLTNESTLVLGQGAADYLALLAISTLESTTVVCLPEGRMDRATEQILRGLEFEQAIVVPHASPVGQKIMREAAEILHDSTPHAAIRVLDVSQMNLGDNVGDAAALLNHFRGDMESVHEIILRELATSK